MAKYRFGVYKNWKKFKILMKIKLGFEVYYGINQKKKFFHVTQMGLLNIIKLSDKNI